MTSASIFAFHFFHNNLLQYLIVELDPEIPDDDMRPPPIINMGPQNQTLQAKTDAVLPCQAHGDPMPTIQWLRNGRPLQMNNPRLMLLGTGSLKISGKIKIVSSHSLKKKLLLFVLFIIILHRFGLEMIHSLQCSVLKSPSAT